ncbi:MAG: NADH:ubiquinone oxidoreductase [Phycisphaerae bacterium]|nr:NADH:ubiquinone oxidoreductase [Phycisphaerae bacterium]
MAKPKMALFSFTCCEGCSLEVLNCENEILDILGALDVTNYREARTNRSDDYDIAFIEGSISREGEIEELKKIRANAKMLIALGACAHTTGLNALKNFRPMADALTEVYGDKGGWFDTIPVRPLKDFVTVDLSLPGCPITKEEFLRVVRELLVGRKPKLPDYPVCVECKMRETICMYHKKQTCLGVVARAGCNAHCPAFGRRCTACRGMVDTPNSQAAKDVMAEFGVTMEQVLDEFRLYNGWTPEAAPPATEAKK